MTQRGGIVPAARRRSLRTLTLAEREDISRGIASGSSIREIASGLQRPVSTVSREVARHGGRLLYRASEADRQDLGNIVRPEYLPPAFLILTLLAVGLNLYLKMAVLLCLDQSQCVAQTLVFNDRSVADSLILAEDAVGKQETPGTYLQPAIWKVDIDVLATQILGVGISFQDDSLTVVR